MVKSFRSLMTLGFTLLFCSATVWLPGQARFDLTGPRIDVRVSRAGTTLPIAAVPNLQPGDSIWLHPALPPSQSVRYLLICVFLRGTTNPPPDEWFTRIETWNKKVREEGVYVTVPAEAQQAILFLAPETGGDFSTLRSAVKGRPGIFVRASQDLTEAGFEQARIEKYLAEIRNVQPGDAEALKQHSDLLARTLALKPNPDCFKRSPDLQYTCLTQTGTQTLLDDGHGQTIVSAISNGPGSDFINAASYTALAGAGSYSAYVGAIVDLVRLTSTLHTAQYQYIPAIAFPDGTSNPDPTAGETLNLRLNTPPSFHNPKSVIVIGLPAVQKVILPPLRPADPNHISCLLNPAMVLPIEGAPLVFSTSFAHDLVLHLNLPGSQQQNLPLTADSFQGGLTIDRNPSPRKELHSQTSAAKPVATPMPLPVVKPSAPAAPGEPITGTIRGFWGFDAYTGPTLPLQNTPGEGWRIVTSAESPSILIAGRPNHVQLEASGTACIQSISLEASEAHVDWKLTTPPLHSTTSDNIERPPAAIPVEPVDVTLNLQHTTTPGSVQLAIQQFGKKDSDQLGTKSFAEPAKIESLQLHSGDLTALLTGNSLDQVKDLTLLSGKQSLAYLPAEAVDSSSKTLSLGLPKDTKPLSAKTNEKISAEVHLEDGRTLQVSTIVLAARPVISILSRHMDLTAPTPIQLGSPDDLPLGAQLTLFLKSKDKFPRNEQIEISSKDSGDPTAPTSPSDPPLKTILSISSGGLVLEDNHTIIATFDPLKTFGPSTFGQFRMRAVTVDGTPGEWIPLATIVRLPALTELHCPAVTAQSCQLSGSALYLIAAVSNDSAFTTPEEVPEGFIDNSLAIPRPTTSARLATAPTGTFYIRLRDDPAAANAVTLPLGPEAGTSAPIRQHPAIPPAAVP